MKFDLVEFFSCQHLVCFFIFRDCLVNDILRQELGQLIDELRRKIAAGTGSDGDLRELQDYVRMRNRIDDGSVSGSGRQ